ncbi:hypothetical protein CLOP_g19745, partial [Closterium sp. NIES-67]
MAATTAIAIVSPTFSHAFGRFGISMKKLSPGSVRPAQRVSASRHRRITAKADSKSLQEQPSADPPSSSSAATDAAATTAQPQRAVKSRAFLVSRRPTVATPFGSLSELLDPWFPGTHSLTHLV